MTSKFNCAWRAWFPSSSTGGRRHRQGWWRVAADCRNTNCCCSCSPEESFHPLQQSRTNQRGTWQGPGPPSETRTTCLQVGEELQINISAISRLATPVTPLWWLHMCMERGANSRAEHARCTILFLCRWVWVFLYESGFLGDHVGNSVDDGICDAKLVVDQLVGRDFKPGGQNKVTWLTGNLPGVVRAQLLIVKLTDYTQKWRFACRHYKIALRDVNRNVKYFTWAASWTVDTLRTQARKCQTPAAIRPSRPWSSSPTQTEMKLPELKACILRCGEQKTIQWKICPKHFATWPQQSERFVRWLFPEERLVQLK